MGGFMAYEGNKPIEVLLPEKLRSYSLTGNGDFPRISKKEIQDKSKGDFISKAVVILQTSWFVMQCIARGVQGLPITELELATIAFAGLNFVIYVLWWDKPLNVQCGVRVYKKRITDSPVDDGHVEITAGFWVALGDALSKLPAAIVHGPLKEDFDDWLWLARVLAWPILKPFFIIIGENDTVDGKRFCTFYPQYREGSIDKLHFTMIVAGIASTFGGIHCIGWSFTFPSSTERTLWRVASISITSVPIVLSISPLDRYDLPPPLRVFFHLCPAPVTAKIIERLFFLPSVLYILSRLVLLTLPFLCLRSLPPAAYHTVQWTSFIPHI
jgi:hypothetical protein